MGIAVEPPSINRSGVDFDVAPEQNLAPGTDGKLAIRYALSAIKGVGEGQAASLVAHAREQPVQEPFRPRATAQSARSKQEGAGKPRLLRRLRRTRAQSRPGLRGRRGDSGQRQPPRGGAAGRTERALWRGGGRRSRFADARRPGRRPKCCGANSRRRAFSCPAIRSMPIAGVLARLRVTALERIFAGGQAGGDGGRLAAVVLDRAERRTKSGSKMGIVQLSDVSGQYEAILFQEGLTQYRDLLEKGAVVLVTLCGESGRRGGARAHRHGRAFGDRGGRAPRRACGFIVRDEIPLDRIKDRLSARGEGEVSLVLTREGPAEEIEIRLPGGYPVSSRQPARSGPFRAWWSGVYLSLRLNNLNVKQEDVIYYHS